MMYRKAEGEFTLFIIFLFFLLVFYSCSKVDNSLETCLTKCQDIYTNQYQYQTNCSTYYFNMTRIHDPAKEIITPCNKTDTTSLREYCFDVCVKSKGD